MALPAVARSTSSLKQSRNSTSASSSRGSQSGGGGGQSLSEKRVKFEEDRFHKMLRDGENTASTSSHQHHGHYSRRVEKLKAFKRARENIMTAKMNAIDLQVKNEDDGLFEYGQSFKLTGLPAVLPPLRVDNRMIDELGLVKLPTGADLSLQPHHHSHPQQQQHPHSHPQSEQAVHHHYHFGKQSRTGNGAPNRWIRDPDMIRWNVERGTVLEVDSETLDNSISSCLEDSNNGNAPLKLGQAIEFDDSDRQIVQRMNNRINFLKNPRFPVASTQNKELIATPLPIIHVHRVHEPPPVVQTFFAAGVESIPSTVVFTDYFPNHTYRETLVLKNRTANSKRFRVLAQTPGEPPSPFFSIKLVKSPVETDGTVAPGMSCTYHVIFTPDCLADFQHKLFVTSESGDEFTVPIEAKRIGPSLSLAQDMVCGPCRAGQSFVSVFDVINKGGAGNFYVLSPHEEENVYEVYKNRNDEIPLEKAGSVKIGPFTVSPPYLSLGTNSSSQIIVKYDPPPPPPQSDQQQQYLEQNYDSSYSFGKLNERATLRLACDNCRIFEYNLVGLAEVPRVSIIVEDGKQQQQYMVSMNDEGGGGGKEVFDEIIHFGHQNPTCTLTRSVTIKNNTKLSIKYRWTVFNHPGDNLYSKTSQIDEFVGEEGGGHDANCFQISQSNGNLSGDEIFDFSIDFKPMKPKRYDSVFELILVPEYQKNLQLPTTAPIELTRDMEKSMYEEILLRVRCIGDGVDPDIRFSPSIVAVPADIYVGETYTTQLRMTCSSCCSHLFTWYLKDIDCEVAEVSLVCPDERIPKNSCMSMDLCITGKFPGIVDGVLVCELDGIESYRYNIRMSFQISMSPTALKFVTRDADVGIVEFGAVRLGNLATVMLPLENNTSVPIHFKLNGYIRSAEPSGKIKLASIEEEEGKEGHGAASSIVEGEHFLIKSSQSSGVILPNSRIEVDLTYVPTWYQDTNVLIECLIFNDQDGREVPVCSVPMHAYVETPRADILFLDDDVSLSPFSAEGRILLNCYLGREKTFKISLKNWSRLESTFNWHPVVVMDDDDNDETRRLMQKNSNYLLGRKDIIVSIYPRESGVIGPEEEMVFDLSVRCNQVGFCNKLRLKCEVDGMVKNNGYAIFDVAVQSNGLEVAMQIKNLEDDSLLQSPKLKVQRSAVLPNLGKKEHHLFIELGDFCPIFHVQKRIIVLKNHSGISCPFNLHVEKFPSSAPPDAPVPGSSKGHHYYRPSTSTTTLSTGGGKSIAPLHHNHHQLEHVQPSAMNKIGFESEEGTKYISSIAQFRNILKQMRTTLSGGSGAAFILQPASGVLEPDGEVEIEVTMVNNLVGVYEDVINCTLVDWLNFSIPVRFQVVGLPIIFSGAQLVPRNHVPIRPNSPLIRNSTEIDRVNFGSRAITAVAETAPTLSSNQQQQHVPKQDQVTFKTFQIENQSPVEIELDWKLYTETIPLDPSIDKAYRGLVPQLSWAQILNLMKAERLDTTGKIFSVTPSSLRLPAFSMATIKVGFTSQSPGHFTSVLVSEVGYVMSDGTVKYDLVPKKNPRNRRLPFKQPAKDHWLMDSIALVQLNGSKTIN